MVLQVLQNQRVSVLILQTWQPSYSESRHWRGLPIVSRHFSTHYVFIQMIFFLRKNKEKKSPKIRKKNPTYKQTILHFCPKNNNRRFLLTCKKVNSRNKNRDFSVPFLVQTLKSNLWSRKNTHEQLVQSSLIFQLYSWQSLKRIYTFIIFYS